MRRALHSRPISAMLVAAATLLGGCGGETTGQQAVDLESVVDSIVRPAPKLVIVGLDGADWNVARPLMAAGKLPVLASLVEQGASGELDSIEPMISPALWTSVMTGVLPDKHGIRDFVFKREGAYEQPIVTSSIRERLAIWNILSAVGLRVGIVDWYASWPAEPVNGFMVSDRIKTMGADADGVVFSTADSLSSILAEPPALGRFPALERLKQVADPLPEGLEKALREDLYRFRVAREAYREERPDFFAFYLKGLDAVGHFYWKEFEPGAEVFDGVDNPDVARLGSILPDYYALCDELLGNFLEVVDETTTVLVLSDHGFRAFGRPDNLIFDLDRLFEAMGLLEFDDPALAGDRARRTIRMERTEAYTHEGTMIVSAFGSRDRPVYLNVAGRDPQGAIEQQGWSDSRARIMARLESLRTDLDSPVFSRVGLNETAPHHGRQEPDLFLRVNPEIAFDYEILVDGRPFSLAEHFFWEYGNISGTHRPQGIFAARGPMIRPGVEIRGASLLDVMPTALHLLGVPVPQDLDGKLLRGILTEPDRRGRLQVASYEDWIERGLPNGNDAPVDEAYRERLRALGYVQ